MGHRFESSRGYIQKNNPAPVTSCGRRRMSQAGPLFKKEDFKPHTMYKKDKQRADTYEEHLALEEKGYGHTPFDKRKRKRKRKKSNEHRKTTKGKGRNFRTVKEGAGMTAKGVKEYRRKNPGSKLKTAVTGKVKPGSKAAKRRKAFCARSRSWTGERGKAARARWKC